MSERAHTKGPWKAEGNFVTHSDGEIVCEIPATYGDDPQAEPDARLIAAAPDMFEALKLAREFIANGIELGFIRMPDVGTPDPAHDTLPAIDAALSKATGEPSDVG